MSIINKNIFEDVETESFPLPDVSGEHPEKGSASRAVKISEDKILSYCEKMGVKPNTLFTGLFGILVAKYSNSDDSFEEKTTIQSYMTGLSEQMMSSMANDSSARYDIHPDLAFVYQAELSDDVPIGDAMEKMPLVIKMRECDHAYVLTARYRSEYVQ